MESTDLWDLYSTPDQGLVKTHGPAVCVGGHCCLHNPSDHHMASWPMMFDEQLAYLALRVCEHHYRHPDPDSLRFFARQNLVTGTLARMALHQCDGCCIV